MFHRHISHLQGANLSALGLLPPHSTGGAIRTTARAADPPPRRRPSLLLARFVVTPATFNLSGGEAQKQLAVAVGVALLFLHLVSI